MKNVHVKLKQNPYKIHIGHGSLNEAGRLCRNLNIGQDAIVITSPRIWKLHGFALSKGLRRGGFSIKVITVPDGERSKSATQAFRVMEEMARYDIFKKPFIVAFGGGVVGDLAGFVAAVYKRGIPYIQVPTTLLAQIDSSIGGKVAVDLAVGKNIVGAFYQPRLVLSDIAALATLPKRQIRNGLAEAVKYGVIYDRKFFSFLEENMPKILSGDGKVLESIVARCGQIKTDVVLLDEKETKGIRTILNFGHTLGHAIEAAGQYRLYQHGEAIALGMRIAGRLSAEIEGFSKKEEQRLNDLLTRAGLPQKIKSLRLSQILSHMKHDKKFLSGRNRFVLTRRIGQTKVKEGLSLAGISRAVKAFL